MPNNDWDNEDEWAEYCETHSPATMVEHVYQHLLTTERTLCNQLQWKLGCRLAMMAILPFLD